jgi:hypothetical protein
MYSSTFLLLCGAFAFTAPIVQAQTDSTVTSNLTTPSVTTTVAINSISTVSPSLTYPTSTETAGNCEPLPYGLGFRPVVDTPDGFLNDAVFSAIARGAPTPLHYIRVYVNEHGATQFGRFLAYHELAMYNTNDCARRCDETEGCDAFNIYLERTPTLDPGPDCENSFSSTTIKCNLWGNQLNASDERTEPYIRWAFVVEVAASNAYNRDGSGLNSAAWALTLASFKLMSAMVLLGFLCFYLYHS